MTWPPLLAGILLCAPAPLVQGAPLQLAQVSGEMLVPGTVSTTPAQVAEEAGTAAADADLTMPEPRPLELVEPVYPSRALRLQLDGRVVVCFTVDETGQVRQPVVVSSTDQLFNEPAVEAIHASRFSPGYSDGQPVKSTACQTYRFVAR